MTIQKTDKSQIIEAAWADYAKAHLPANTPSSIQSLRRDAFFSGADVVFNAITGADIPAEQELHQQISAIDTVEQELLRFRAERHEGE